VSSAGRRRHKKSRPRKPEPPQHSHHEPASAHIAFSRHPHWSGSEVHGYLQLGHPGQFNSSRIKVEARVWYEAELYRHLMHSRRHLVLGIFNRCLDQNMALINSLLAYSFWMNVLRYLFSNSIGHRLVN